MRFDDAPAVPGAAVRLRPVGMADIDDWFAYLSIPEVVENTSWDLDRAQALKPMIEWYDAAEPSSAIRFAIVPQGGDRLIGTIGFHTISLAHRSAEVAYDIAPSHWGRGIASACCRAVVEWGFGTLGYRRVQATALDSNVASVRMLQKCGFALEGKLRSYRIVRGVSRDFWMYSRVA